MDAKASKTRTEVRSKFISSLKEGKTMKDLARIFEDFLKDLERLVEDRHSIAFCTISVKVCENPTSFVRGFMVEKKQDFKFVFIQEMIKALLLQNRQATSKCLIEILLQDNILQKRIIRRYNCFCYLRKGGELLISLEKTNKKRRMLFWRKIKSA